ncbi:MAG: LexA family protein [Bulleidia sp.]
MELSSLIREFKEKTGMSDSRIAKECGVSRSTVMRWANGDIRRLSSETTEKLSRLLGYNIALQLQDIDVTFRLPVLGYVKAGYDLLCEENWLGEEEVSLSERKKGDYYLKVTGDSMIGCGIMDGSLVLVHQTSTLNHGDIGVVMIGDEVTVKKVLFKNDLLILEAANPSVPGRIFTAQEVSSLPVKIIGKVLSCKTYY